MDQEVKREREEKQGPETVSWAAEEVDDVTLSELYKSLKPKPKPDSRPSSSTRKPLEKKENCSKMKDSLVSKIKNDVLSQTEKFVSFKNGKATFEGHGGARSSAVIRGEELRSNLEPEYPSFVKSLVRSHVAGCFWMGLPGKFCKAYLPDKDTGITLEDECGKNYVLKYIAYKTGLSAGWRQFSAAHKLVEGDVLVFQLVEPTKFKVYIIRPNALTEVDGALGLLNLDAQTKQSDADNVEMGSVASSNTNRKRLTSLRIGVIKKKKKIGLLRSIPNLRQLAEQSSY